VFKRNKPAPPPTSVPASMPDSTPASTPASTPGPDTRFAKIESPGNVVRPADSGVGVPPFRPAATKEAPALSQSRFLNPSAQPQPQPAPSPGTPAPRPGASAVAPAGGSAPPSSSAAAISVRPGGREPVERRTLVVGRGISVQGVVQDAERLVVEGTVEASMIHATELAISAGGVFRGEVEVEDAEVAGTIDGTLTARGNLVVRSTGRVLGVARCRRLQVEDGGQITGRIEMITESTPRIVESRVEAIAS
jgi:cytoskeletal protein CcmA (bactofilin family)